MKYLISLFLFLILAPIAWSQIDTVWIAPTYYLTVDTNEWEILFDSPDPVMVHHTPIPQQISHRETGMAIIFHAAYGVEEKMMNWLSARQKQEGMDNPSSKFLSLQDGPKQMRNLLFGNLISQPQFDSAQFEAYTIGNMEQKLANAYLWIHKPYYLLVSSNQLVTEENQTLLLEILSRIQLTSPERMDQAMRTPASKTIVAEKWRTQRASWIRIQVGKSHYQRSKSKIRESSDDDLIAPIDSSFSFVTMDNHLRKLWTDEPDLHMVFSHVKSPLAPQTDDYHNYHISPYRLVLCYEFLLLYSIWKQFPEDVLSAEMLPFQQTDSLRTYCAFNANNYYLLNIGFEGQSVHIQVDSLHLNLLEYHNGGIRQKSLTSKTYIDSFVHKDVLPGDGSQFILRTPMHIRQGKKIAEIYDHWYFYTPQRSRQRLKPFSPPQNLKPYDALIRYYLDENDQYLIKKHFAARDTVRFYHDCDLRDDSPDMLFYKGVKEQELKTPPDKRLYGTNLITTDLNANGHNEYWQVYVSNGHVVQNHFFAAYAADDSLNTSKSRKALMQLPQLKKLLTISQSNGINNHQLLCRSIETGLFQDEEYPMAVAETTFDEDFRKRIEADTSVYHYPHRPAFFQKNNSNAEGYLANHLSAKKYSALPDIARYKVSFIVEKDGSFTNFHIQSLGSKPVYAIETDLMEILMRMPKWQPAKVEDVPVRSYGALYFGIYVK